MIITRERLTELARQEAEKRADRGRLLTAFLIGSVAHGEPLFAGCADIDMVFIHPSPPVRAREVVPLSPDVHFDIFHRHQSDFDPPRELRTDPDLGPDLYHAIPLHDPDHYFDWVQAAACAQFSRADNQLARSHALLARARQAHRELDSTDPSWSGCFLQSALDGANALAGLATGPASGRLIINQLRTALLSADRPDLMGQFLGLYGADDLSGWHLGEWLAAWAKAYDRSLEQTTSSPLDPVRRDYFLRAFQQLAEENQAEAVVLPLILNWPELPSPPVEADGRLAEETSRAWQDLLIATGLGADSREKRQGELEAFLDEVERYLVRWGEDHGA